jgi:thiol:disulfide interchange protein
MKIVAPRSFQEDTVVRGFRFGLAVLTLLAAATASPHAGAPAEEKVTLQKIKYNDLGRVIRGLKGKVVVVDFWAFW